MSAITLTRLYEFLVPKLGKDATEGLITYNESKIKSEVENACKDLATKNDITVIKADISLMRQDIAKLEGKIDSKVSESKAEIIKWMFVFWIGQVIATTASIILFLKK